MRRRAFIVTVPRAGNRRFRVFGLTRDRAELHFLFSVDEEVPDKLRQGNTDIRFRHDDIAFGRVRVELDTQQNLVETDDVVEVATSSQPQN